MIDAIAALEAVHELGTMGLAAAKLRITQSAVSKRIAALEETVGADLIQKAGRRVRLTAQGSSFLAKARPLVRELNSLLHSFEEDPRGGPFRGKIILGVAESVLSSWGAGTLRAASRKLPGLELVLHSHRSHLVIEHVRSGDYMLGLCTDPLNDQSLESEILIEEPLVIVPSGLRKMALKRGQSLEVISVEEGSATWRILRDRLRRGGADPSYRLSWGARVESFSAVVQMARSGLGHGLVPLGIARAMAVPSSRLIRLGGEFHRPVALVGRPTSMSRPFVRAFKEALQAGLPSF